MSIQVIDITEDNIAAFNGVLADVLESIALLILGVCGLPAFVPILISALEAIPQLSDPDADLLDYISVICGMIPSETAEHFAMLISPLAAVDTNLQSGDHYITINEIQTMMGEEGTNYFHKATCVMNSDGTEMKKLTFERAYY